MEKEKDDHKSPQRSKRKHCQTLTPVEEETITRTTKKLKLPTVTHSRDCSHTPFHSVPDVLVTLIAHNFLTDYEAVTFGRSAKRILHTLKPYGIKRSFESVHLSDDWPSYHPFHIGQLEHVRLLANCEDEPEPISSLPPTVQYITIAKDVVISFDEFMALPPKLIALQLDAEDDIFQKWYVRVTDDEYNEWTTNQMPPIQLPATMTKLSLPIFFVGENFDPYHLNSIPPIVFISLPPDLTYLHTHSLNDLSLPDSLTTLLCDVRDLPGNHSLTRLPTPLRLLRLSGIFPPSLNMNHPLPPNLTELCLDPRHSGEVMPIDAIAALSWPDSLTAINFRRPFNQPLEHLTLPPSLTALDLYPTWFNHPLELL